MKKKNIYNKNTNIENNLKNKKKKKKLPVSVPPCPAQSWQWSQSNTLWLIVTIVAVFLTNILLLFNISNHNIECTNKSL